ncbi:MAG: hypothetical protein ACXWZR_16265, partial [Mycobacterium sp.]
FTTHTDTHLWRSDGTEAGTYFVPGSPNNVGQLTAFGNRVYFTGDNMLWRSDGTLAGTKTVKNSKGAIVKSPAAMAATDSLLFYEFNESKVWRSNGTAAGTFKILDLGPGCTGYNCFPMQLRGDGNLMYFGGGDSLMRSDGTVAGTFRVGPGLDGWPAQMTGAGGAFYFSTYPGLWSTDGAPDSAHLIDLGPADGCCNGLADIDGTLFFSGSQGSGDAYVLKLFRYDAATDTTTEVGPTTAERPYDLTVVGDRVLFSARDSRGAELWAVDL